MSQWEGLVSHSVRCWAGSSLIKRLLDEFASTPIGSVPPPPIFVGGVGPASSLEFASIEWGVQGSNRILFVFSSLWFYWFCNICQSSLWFRWVYLLSSPSFTLCCRSRVVLLLGLVMWCSFRSGRKGVFKSNRFVLWVCSFLSSSSFIPFCVCPPFGK